MNIPEHRKAIDKLDAQIVRLLNERTRHVLAIGSIKLKAGEEIYAPHRERAVFERICKLNNGPITGDQLRAIYREIMSSALALEKTMTIAYRQPITRAEVEQIRGVNVDGTMQTIMERGLVEAVGRAEVVGRPPTYGTTALFLEYFGLGSLEDLPAADELRRIPITKPPAPVTADPGLATTPPEQLQLNEEGKMKNEEMPAISAVENPPPANP